MSADEPPGGGAPGQPAQGPLPPPAQGPPPPVAREEVVLDEDARPATVGELRSVRRWLLVAGVWAVAATAIAVIALLAANDNDEAGLREAQGELGRVQRQLNGRIDDLEDRIDELPTQADVANLEDRLKAVEDASQKAATGVSRANGRIDELEGQVEELEQAVAESADNSGTTPTETAP